MRKTYICEGAERAQEADNYQTQHKKFTSVRQLIRIFVQHSGDDRLQPTKLKHAEKMSDLQYYNLQIEGIRLNKRWIYCI